MHAGGISAVLDESLEASGVGAGHFAVALEGEDQGDVYGLAAGDHLLYSNEPWQGGRYLDEEVGSVDHLVQPGGLLDRGLRVVGYVGLDLQGDKAIPPPVSSWTGMKMSQASLMSFLATSQKICFGSSSV